MLEIYEKISKIMRQGEAGVLVTVIDKQGSVPTSVQAKILFLKNGDSIGTIGGGKIEHEARREAETILQTKQSYSKKYRLSDNQDILDNAQQTGMICGGDMTLFYDYISSGENLYIFGAGHIGKALVYHLKNLNYRINLIDCRQKAIDEITAPINARLVRYDVDYDQHHEFNIVDDAYIIIATHSHDLDYVVLKNILKKEIRVKYLGLVASRKKVAEMSACLKNDPDVTIALNLNELYSPIGLDIGGQAPDEIALAIIAEIQAIKYGKSGHKHLNTKSEIK